MNILVVNSSAQGENSVSTTLSRDFVEQVRASDPAAKVTVRDVGSQPLPHLTAHTVAAIRGTAETEEEQRTLALSDAAVSELQDADVIVIGAPMYNFGIASTLKAWFDHVLRARVTFRYTEAGPEGLLKGKRAIVIETRAGVYSGGPAMAQDSQEQHLRTLLNFMGIDDIVFVRVEGTAFGPEAAEMAIEGARGELAALAQAPLALAA
jgi:FMN-dependent NADH-azoreductase